MRGISMTLLPLTANELAELLSGGPVTSEAHDLPLLRAVARGLAVAQIARQVGVSPRTVYRRTAALKKQFGVTDLQALATELARRGF